MYFDVSTGDQKLGTIVIGMFGKIVPKTVKNFITYAGEGHDGKKYEGSKFHRVIKEFMIQGKYFVKSTSTLKTYAVVFLGISFV